MKSITLLFFMSILMTICMDNADGKISSIQHNSTNANFVMIPESKLGGPLLQIKGVKIIQFWNWFQSLSKTDDNFIGRCFGVARKLKFLMPLIIFKLGIIVTTLAFLTIFSLKSLGIGILLLILNTGGLFGKLALLKAGAGGGGGGHHHHDYGREHFVPSYVPFVQPAPQQPPQTVHFHVHRDKEVEVHHSGEGHHGGGGEGYKYETGPPTAWGDRVSSGLSQTRTSAERKELMDLYRRLGFDVNKYMGMMGQYAS